MKRFKELDDDARSLAESGQWLQLLKSLKAGTYEVQTKNFSELRSLQVTASKVNVLAEHPYRIATKARYDKLLVQIDVDRK